MKVIWIWNLVTWVMAVKLVPQETLPIYHPSVMPRRFLQYQKLKIGRVNGIEGKKPSENHVFLLLFITSDILPIANILPSIMSDCRFPLKLASAFLISVFQLEIERSVMLPAAPFVAEASPILSDGTSPGSNNTHSVPCSPLLDRFLALPISPAHGSYVQMESKIFSILFVSLKNG